MKKPFYDYAVIGGDMRQTYLMQELAADPCRITCFAVMHMPDRRRCSDKAIIDLSSSLKDAFEHSRCILGPTPLVKKPGILHQNAYGKDIPLGALLEMLRPKQYFFAGNIPTDFLSSAREKGVLIFDYMRDTSFAIYNSIATAEGAICEAIQKSPQNLSQSRCAVLGYGKCGRSLARCLSGMQCHVSVFSREEEERAYASIMTGDSGTLKDFTRRIAGFDFVFNTIPARIITEDTLRLARRDTIFIDIASAPGGVDLCAAKNLGITAGLYPGLPGRYAPLSCARALKTNILSVLSPTETISCETV